MNGFSKLFLALGLAFASFDCSGLDSKDCFKGFAIGAAPCVTTIKELRRGESFTEETRLYGWLPAKLLAALVVYKAYNSGRLDEPASIALILSSGVSALELAWIYKYISWR